MGHPGLLAKKTQRPVLLRVSRDEEYSFGRARAGFQGWIKMGFRKDGRITAVDMYVVHSNGPTAAFGITKTPGKPCRLSINHWPCAGAASRC